MANPYKKRKKQSERMKELWKDPEFRQQRSEEQSEIMTERWKDPVFREQQEKERKERWNNPEYRKKMEKSLSKADNEELKEKISKKQKENFKNEDRLNKHKQMLKDTKEIRQEKQTENWNDPVFIYNIMSSRCNHEKALEVIEKRLGEKIRKEFEENL
jgi:hypothetical protein